MANVTITATRLRNMITKNAHADDDLEFTLKNVRDQRTTIGVRGAVINTRHDVAVEIDTVDTTDLTQATTPSDLIGGAYKYRVVTRSTGDTIKEGAAETIYDLVETTRAALQLPPLAPVEKRFR